MCEISMNYGGCSGKMKPKQRPRADGDSAWLTQGEFAELFGTTQQNVSLHAKSILEEGE